MTERPILMSAPMVRAILAGRKTQTRRVVKPQPDEDGLSKPHAIMHWHDTSERLYRCPYGKPGDRLWVRENGWERPERTPRMMREGADTWKGYYFDASISSADHEQFKEWGFKRRPSIHMPRRVCRLVLEVTGVRVERLFALSEEDARAEGIMRVPFHVKYAGSPTHGWSSDEGQPVSTTARRAYQDLWFSINGAWLDCWVWVVEFKQFDPVAAMPPADAGRIADAMEVGGSDFP